MDSRVLTIAFGWLLFPDLRSHFKKSIPWLRKKTEPETPIIFVAGTSKQTSNQTSNPTDEA